VRLVEAPSPAQLAAVTAVPGVTDVAVSSAPNDAASPAHDAAPSEELDDHSGAVDAVLTCRLTDLRHHAPAVVRALVEAGAQIIGVREESRTLEDVYFEVMGRRPQVEELS
jgi:hypothetical protein